MHILCVVVVFLNQLRTDITGHDDDGVFEVGYTSFIVGKPAIVKHLQQNVEHIGMGFFDFIEEYNRIGFTPNGFGELSAFVIAYIARRRTYQPANGMTLLVFTHVYAGHGIFVIEQEFAQSLGQFGFSDSGGTQEDERADGLALIAKSGAAASYGITHGLNGFCLPDHTLAQLQFEPQQFGPFAFHQRLYRYACPA